MLHMESAEERRDEQIWGEKENSTEIRTGKNDLQLRGEKRTHMTGAHINSVMIFWPLLQELIENVAGN